MIVTVTSKDGVTLYAKAKAASYTQFLVAQDLLRRAAAAQDSAELLMDGYYLNQGCAQLGLPCAECRSKVKAA